MNSDMAMNTNFETRVIGDDQRARESRPLREQLSEQDHGSSPTRRMAAYHSDTDLVGRSQAFFEIAKQVEWVAQTDQPVLLTGESGTGKELVASAIHQRSSRAGKPFVAVKCDAIAAESIESEVFGHVQGAFAGADQDRSGLCEEADGGTVFFDEITETTPGFQEKLLRALQTGEFCRVGSHQANKVDVRVIATTNRNMDQETAAGRFRNDLFQHLNAKSIALPPLRERPAEIAALAQGFADRVYSLNPPVKFSTEAVALLERYSWPGNMRELENAVVRAVAMCDGTVRVKDLPERVRNYSQMPAPTNGQPVEASQEEWVPLSTIEGRYVAQVLEHTRGNKQAAARVLAVDRKTLDRMIKRHHIDSEKVRRAYR